MMTIMNWLSRAAIPGFIMIILLIGAFRNVPVFDTFIEGAIDGLRTVLLKPIADFFDIPKEIIPMAILRPISGSASLGLLNQQLKEYGPDSFIGKTLSVMMGSTETIFYTIAVYFGAIGVKKSRNTLWIALIAGAAGLISSVIVCRLLP